MNYNKSFEDKIIAVIGLGYVGLPLALAFSNKKVKVIGFDINQKRIEQLKKNKDVTLEVEESDLKLETTLTFTSNISDISEASIFIVTVPTPITEHKYPDLTPLKSASKTIGSLLKKDDIVIYESTVYPGCTEEVCVPILEKESQLKYNKDFFCGYSPERINPGDKTHRVNTIIKVTSGSTPKIADTVDNLYKLIIDAGTHKASSIKVAEAAKVIENSQRDVNIAFVNELAVIFNKMGIDTNQVLEAAATKWNFLPFKPGLVGGHCIGVDPYYLTFKAESLGYKPKVILSGRSINDNMGQYIAQRVVKSMIKKGEALKDVDVCILGFTFKENCPDTRNTKVIDIKKELEDFGINVDVFDDNADPNQVKEEYQIDLVPSINTKNYKALILAVAHDTFKRIDFEPYLSKTITIFDVKGILDNSLEKIERL